MYDSSSLLAKAILVGNALEPRFAVHPEQRAALISYRLAPPVWRSEGAQRFLLAQLQACPAWPTLPIFRRPIEALLGIGWQRLRRLTVFVGATVVGMEIRRVVDAHQVKLLRERLGIFLYEFVLWRAPLICTGDRASNLPIDDPGYRKFLRIVGARVIHDALSEVDQGWSNLRLRLSDREIRAVEAMAALSPSYCMDVAMKTMRELEPEWYALAIALEQSSSHGKD